MTVMITNYGAKLVAIMVPNKKGVFADVLQGYETINQAAAGQGSMGHFAGRYVNRIVDAKFTLNGQEYKVGLNENKENGLFNMLHGGVLGTRFMIFDAKQLDSANVEMFYTFKDGEEGFPRTLPVRVHYSVTDNNELKV